MKRLIESEVFVDRHGVAYDDEGNRWQSGMRGGTYRGRDVPGPRPDQSWRNRTEKESAQVRAISKAFTEAPGNGFLRSMFSLAGKTPLRMSDKQRDALRRTLHKMKMHKEAKLFEGEELGGEISEMTGDKMTKMGPVKIRIQDKVLLGKEKNPRDVVYISNFAADPDASSVLLGPIKKPTRSMRFEGQRYLFWDSGVKEFYTQSASGSSMKTVRYKPSEVKVIKMEKVAEGMSGVLRRLEELIERKVRIAGLSALRLTDPKNGTMSYTIDMGKHFYTLRELDPAKGIWGIQVRGGINPPDGVLLRKRFEWLKSKDAGDAIRDVHGMSMDNEPPVVDAAKYIASGKAAKDVEDGKWIKANKRMWESEQLDEWGGRRSYPRDPYWLTAKYPGKDANGKPFKKGEKVFYYPNTKTFLTGKDAEKASREFEAAKADEYNATRGMY